MSTVEIYKDITLEELPLYSLGRVNGIIIVINQTTGESMNNKHDMSAYLDSDLYTVYDIA